MSNIEKSAQHRNVRRAVCLYSMNHGISWYWRGSHVSWTTGQDFRRRQLAQCEQVTSHLSVRLVGCARAHTHAHTRGSFFALNHSPDGPVPPKIIFHPGNEGGVSCIEMNILNSCVLCSLRVSNRHIWMTYELWGNLALVCAPFQSLPRLKVWRVSGGISNRTEENQCSPDRK